MTDRSEEAAPPTGAEPGPDEVSEGVLQMLATVRGMVFRPGLDSATEQAAMMGELAQVWEAAEALISRWGCQEVVRPLVVLVYGTVETLTATSPAYARSALDTALGLADLLAGGSSPARLYLKRALADVTVLPEVPSDLGEAHRLVTGLVFATVYLAIGTEVSKTVSLGQRPAGRKPRTSRSHRKGRR